MTTTVAAKTTQTDGLVLVKAATPITRGERIPAPPASYTPPAMCQYRGCKLAWKSCPGHR